MSGRFEGWDAVVTGAASGIGAAIRDALLREGASVLAIDLVPPAGEVAVGEPSGRLRWRQADVGDEGGVAAAVAGVTAAGRGLALFNAAGVGGTTSALETSVGEWDRIMGVNARGTFLMCKHLLPAMVAGGGGAIVNIASIAGLIGLRGRVAYCASKGAVIALTRALAVDHVADGVRVNCVCPGNVETPLVRRLVEHAGSSLEQLQDAQPMRRLGRPEEIAEAALYLASDAAAFATGTILTIDGGRTAE